MTTTKQWLMKEKSNCLNVKKKSLLVEINKKYKSKHINNIKDIDLFLYKKFRFIFSNFLMFKKTLLTHFEKNLKFFFLFLTKTTKTVFEQY